MAVVPTLIYVRHVESAHNAAVYHNASTHGLRDAPITATGRQQLLALAANVQTLLQCSGISEDRIVVFCSPLTRAIQTACGAFPESSRIIALPLISEVVHADCDIGRSKSCLQAEFKARVDFSLCEERWWYGHEVLSAEDERLYADDAWCVDGGCPFRPSSTTTRQGFISCPREPDENLLGRVRKFREWLLKGAGGLFDDAQLVFIVSHNGFLRTMLNTKQGFKNGEMRRRSPFAVAVLGKKLTDNGEPSEDLKVRVEHACNFVRAKQLSNECNGSILVLVLSGGQHHTKSSAAPVPNATGTSEISLVLSEADAMAALAKTKYSMYWMIKEAHSTSTIENAIEICKVLTGSGIQQMVVVTADYHMDRARKIFSVIAGRYHGYGLLFEPAPCSKVMPSDSLRMHEGTESYLLPKVNQSLQSLGYRSDGMSKFTPNGQLARFVGCTFVCAVPVSSIQFEHLCRAQEVLKSSKIARYFSFLPPSSFHMTVMDLHNRLPPEGYRSWTEYMSSVIVDAKNTVSSAPWTLFRVRFGSVTSSCIMVEVDPAGARQKSALASWRANVGAALKISVDEKYRFHITLCYQLYALETLEEKEELIKVHNEMTAILKDFGELDLEPPRLCRFGDMSDFLPLVGIHVKEEVRYSSVKGSVAIVYDSEETGEVAMLRLYRASKAPEYTMLDRRWTLGWQFVGLRDGYLSYKPHSGQCNIACVDSIVNSFTTVRDFQLPPNASHYINITPISVHNDWPPHQDVLFYFAETGSVMLVTVKMFTSAAGDGTFDDRSALVSIGQHDGELPQHLLCLKSISSSRLIGYSTKGHLYLINMSRTGMTLTIEPAVLLSDTVGRDYTHLLVWAFAKSNFRVVLMSNETGEIECLDIAQQRNVKVVFRKHMDLCRNVSAVAECAFQGVQHALILTQDAHLCTYDSDFEQIGNAHPVSVVNGTTLTVIDRY